jgi:hypothetical protein
MAVKGSKNDIKNRGKAAELKKFNGQVIMPVEYRGNNLGHGNYMAGKLPDGKLLRDNVNRPIPYHLIQSDTSSNAGSNEDLN